MRDRLKEVEALIADHERNEGKLVREQRELERSIKLAIGTAKGIRGIATWETTDGRRRIDPELIKEQDPELYEKYVEYTPKFVAARLKKELPAVYQQYQRVQRTRVFLLLDGSPLRAEPSLDDEPDEL